MVKRFDPFNLTRIQFFMFFICAFCILLIPLFNHQYVSINDLINHFSRVWILLHYRNTPSIHAFYRVTWHAVPNMALDVFGFVVGRFVSLDLASKLFVAAMIGVNLIGVVRLHRAVHGKWTIWPLLASPLMFSRLFLAGIVNYLFGIGLALNALAFHIALREKPLARCAVLTGFALATYFSHLLALGLLGLAIFGIELTWLFSSADPLARRLGRAVLSMLPFVPAVAIFFWITPHGDVAGSVRFHTMAGRLTAFGTPILYDPLTDIVLYAVLIAGVVLAVSNRKQVQVYWPLTGALLMLLLLQLVAPFSIITSTNVDQRIPIFIYLLAIAAVDATPRGWFGKTAFATILIAVVGARVWTVDERWRSFDAIYADVDATLSAIPKGARVASVFPREKLGHASAPSIAVFYLPVHAVVRNDGFAQTLFALPLQDTVVLTPRYQSLAVRTDTDLIWHAFTEPADASPGLRNRLEATALFDSYDYVVFVDNQAHMAVHPAPGMKLVAGGRYSQAYLIENRSPEHPPHGPVPSPTDGHRPLGDLPAGQQSPLLTSF
jgi:hypothetical protein